MKRIALTLLLTAFASVGAVRAETPELSPEVRGEINSIIGNAINAVTIFSSQSTVSSGHFRIKVDDGPDSDMEVVRVPIRKEFPGKAPFTPFAELLLGYVRIEEHFPPVEGEGEDDFSRIRTYSAGAGAGVKVDVAEGLSVSPAFALFYSNTRNRYDYNNEFSQQILQPYGKALFGWNVETLTYVPNVRVDYEAPLGGPTLLLWSKYSQLFNDSISTNSSTIHINSDTGLWQNSAGIQVPLGAEVQDKPLAARATLIRSDVYGDGRRGLEFGYFWETTAEVLASLSGSPSEPKRELTLGMSYTFADELHGWRVGVGYDL